jgi:pimeloyl-ACP methyl ester carboxylesterase
MLLDVDGIGYSYRRFGAANGVPVVFLQHVTGTMDYWDPAVVDGFARERPAILVDYPGVGRSGGSTPDTVQGLAERVVAFIGALGLRQVDLLGFSLGGFVAQVIAAEHPDLVRRVILAGTGPEGGEGIQTLGNVLMQGLQKSPAEPRLYLFFEQSESSQHAGRAFIERQTRRMGDREPNISDQAATAELTAIGRWGSPQGNESAARLPAMTQPVLVVNGKNDLLVPTINSYALFQRLPNAELHLYPDSGHGALFQYAEEFVREGLRFLEG